MRRHIFRFHHDLLTTIEMGVGMGVGDGVAKAISTQI